VTELRGGSSLLAADGVAVRQVALHCQLPLEALLSPPILCPSWGEWMRVARLAGVGKGRGESAPPASINVDSEQLVSSTSTGNGSKGTPLLYNT
jgi:hypothetical protein